MAMPVILAPKTLVQIEHTIRADQGASFRTWLGKVMPHMDDAFRGADDGFRSHLGGSVIGGECGRAIWYGFRWVSKPKFSGKVIRLFNRGHTEEARFIAMLLTIGVQVYQQDANGKQYRISHVGGHFGGAGDGVGVGVPDVPPGAAILLEFKTHNEKSFNELAGTNWKDFMEWLAYPERFHPKKTPTFEGVGVREAKFEHYVQMQVYMRKMGLPMALYMAVNKNTDEVYAEVVTLDVAVADQFLDRGRTIIMLKEAPKKISESPGFFKCKWCDYNEICHQDAPVLLNCRTCRFSEAIEDGTWMCNSPVRQKELLNTATNPHNETFELTKERQLVGCGNYVPIK